MATAAHVSVDEYLAYSGKPNCEYIDGVLKPKAMGTSKHARVQGRIFRLLQDLGYDAGVELTVRVSPTKFLVPDVAADTHLADPYPDRPVLLCVEILSPEDRAGEMFKTCELYHEWGVPYCWVIDPIEETAWEYHRGSCVNQCTETLSAAEIQILMSAVFQSHVMTGGQQIALAIAPTVLPTLTVLIGLLMSNRQIDLLRSEMNGLRSELHSFRGEVHREFDLTRELFTDRSLTLKTE